MVGAALVDVERAMLGAALVGLPRIVREIDDVAPVQSCI
jgi:hypothetical protein